MSVVSRRGHHVLLRALPISLQATVVDVRRSRSPLYVYVVAEVYVQWREGRDSLHVNGLCLRSSEEGMLLDFFNPRLIYLHWYVFEYTRVFTVLLIDASARMVMSE